MDKISHYELRVNYGQSGQLDAEGPIMCDSHIVGTIISNNNVRDYYHTKIFVEDF